MLIRLTANNERSIFGEGSDETLAGSTSMNDPPSAGNFLSVVEEARRPDQVVGWFVERGWESSAIPGGHFVVRSGCVELVVSAGPRALHGGRQVVVRGFLADAVADGPRIAEIIASAVVSHRSRWGDLDGDGRLEAKLDNVTRSRSPA
jgi:hypothetical protein